MAEELAVTTQQLLEKIIQKTQNGEIRWDCIIERVYAAQYKGMRLSIIMFARSIIFSVTNTDGKSELEIEGMLTATLYELYRVVEKMVEKANQEPKVTGSERAWRELTGKIF